MTMGPLVDFERKQKRAKIKVREIVTPAAMSNQFGTG